MMNSFVYAGEGLYEAFLRNRNFKIQIGISFCVLIVGFLLNITKTDWILLLMTLVLGLCIEMLNSAVEEMTNLITAKWSIHAKKAKDIAAGAMLLYSFFAVIIGLLIFYPYVFLIFNK